MNKRTPTKSRQQRLRSARLFPVMPFQDSLTLPDAIQKYAGGQKVRRLTLFEKLDRSPDSNESRRLITSSSQYKLTKGSYKAEYLELTPEGATATGEDVPSIKKLQTRFDLAIINIAPFQFLYEKIKGNKLPAKEILSDYLAESGVDDDQRPECIEIFILNVKFLGLLRTIAGSERLITIEHALEEAPKVLGDQDKGTGTPIAGKAAVLAQPTEKHAGGPSTDLSKTCFYISPIGDENSDARRHADFLMEYNHARRERVRTGGR